MRAKRLILGLLAALACLVVFAPAAADAAFGFNEVELNFEEEDGTAASRAGSHPFALTNLLSLNSRPDALQVEVPEDQIKDLRITMPPGLVGNPTAVSPCSTVDFATIVGKVSSCPSSTAVGIGEVKVALPFEAPQLIPVAVYNLEPPPGVAAEIGFVALGEPVTIDLSVNSEPPYNVIAHLSDIPQAIRFFGSRLSVWGNPASPTHDQQRGTCAVTPQEDRCSSGLTEKPFLTMPRSCTGPLQSLFRTDSWQDPSRQLAYPRSTSWGMNGCQGLAFHPRISSSPTSRSAESSSGLTFHLDIDDPGLTSPGGVAHSDIKKAVVTLPTGMTVNPSIASGLAACTEADLQKERADSEPGEGCPQASKVGEVEVETPLLEGKLLTGEVFVASQGANPFHSLLAIYMVIREPKLGILIRLPGRVTPDPLTGRLVTTFGEPGFEIPQFPFSHFRFRFHGGARAPLITPPDCGTYQTEAVLYPWARPDDPYATTASFQIGSGVGGGPCPPGGAAPFAPGYQAGTTNNAAGNYAPFLMRLTRQDGEQDLTRLSTTLPPGLVGKIAGLNRCPEAAIAAAKLESGRQQLVAPSCPSSSTIGGTLAGSGVGGSLTYVPGSLYLAGPFAGAPLSVVAITPAVAGPFDLGTVVIREALNLDPFTAQVTVDGSASEPIPHILKGIPLRLRDLRVHADRPEFTLNPTSCEEEQARATLFGGGTALAPLADRPVGLSARFQAAGCASLRFKPKLKIRLKGATRRIGHPALKAVVTYPKKGTYANIGRAQVNLPHGEFLDQGNLNKTCTRPVLLAGNCPKSSVYGHAKAWTPLLEHPLQGPVYLVGGFGYKLPALVAELNGQFRILLVGKIDSGKNRGIRSTFEMVPDAPVSRFVLEMKGGRKYGLLQNSENLCKAKKSRRRAIARFTGQNGRVHQFKPVVANQCGKHGKGTKKRRENAHSRNRASSGRGGKR